MHSLLKILRRLRGPLIAYTILGLALWPVPLLNRLHVESAAVVAAVAYFAAGLSALALFRDGTRFRRVLSWQEGCLLVPWALLTVSMLWAPNCGYFQGLLFFVLFPVVTVIFAVGLAYLLSAFPVRGKQWWLIGIGIAIMVLGPLYDLGGHPQFYSYNHVFGGVLGPIYDEELAIRFGLFAFRGLTLLWASLFFVTGRWMRIRGKDRELKIENRGRRDAKDTEQKSMLPSLSTILERPAACRSGVLVIAFCIGTVYLFSARLGINTPAWHLQGQLGGKMQTEHFNIYFAPGAISEEGLERLAQQHEYQYDRLADLLGIGPEERISSYLYPDPSTKARLTGARYTSIAPVWLSTPQMHMLRKTAEASLAHELGHVFSRSFGLPILRASIAAGLVEGVAVALEPASGRPTPSEKVASTLEGTGPVGPDVVDGVAERLHPLGFWTGRGAVSYAAVGSFVKYLLDAYGASSFRRVYAWAEFEEVYGKPVEELAREWKERLLEQPVVSRAAGPVARERFSVPSLFEQRCPHHVPSYRQRYRAARSALAQEDTTRALNEVRRSLEVWPRYPAALSLWASIQLGRGHSKAVRLRLEDLPAEKLTAPLWRHRGDAEALLGRPAAAQRFYERARDRLPLYAHSAAARLLLREIVADRRPIMRVLTSGAPAESQAEALGNTPGRRQPVVRTLRALRLNEAGAHEQAWRMLRSVTLKMERRDLPPGIRTSMTRQMLVWRARVAYRAGQLVSAGRLAREAAERYRLVGDFNSAAHLRALGREIQWLRHNS